MKSSTGQHLAVGQSVQVHRQCDHKRTRRSRQSKRLQSIKAEGIRTPRAEERQEKLGTYKHTNATPVSINNALPSDNFLLRLPPPSMLPANGSIILPLAAITIRFDSRLIVAYTHRCHWLLPHSISVFFRLLCGLCLCLQLTVMQFAVCCWLHSAKSPFIHSVIADCGN